MIRFAPKLPVLLSPVLVAGALCLCAPALGAPPPADDDEAPASVSHPVVEPTGPSAGRALNAALVELAKDPRNVAALLDAGNAATALGDNEAALGFLTRAEQVAPTNAVVKAAIAGARLHLDDPVEALRRYAQAEQAGGDPATFALDRGLAFDLVGDNAAAVAQYRIVLAHSTDQSVRDEATRRLAISLAIGGDRRAADLALLPMLQRQDRAAWRAHVFVLAIAGRGDDAVAVTRASMPTDLAAAIGPYLRFMVQLTPAQQAAVASLGRFPRAADIGRDDPRVVAYAAAHPRVALTPAPTRTAALAQATPAPDTAHARRRKAHEPAANATAPVAQPVAEQADIVLPPPPPPPTALASAAAPGAPLASRDTTPPVSALVPQPTVLSRLDMPPTHHVPAPHVSQGPVFKPAIPPATTTLAMSTPPAQPFAAPASTGAGFAAIPLPASVPQPDPASHPVVEAIPEQPVAARPEPARPPQHVQKTAPELPVAAKDKPGRARDQHAKSAIDKHDNAADDDAHGTRAKSASAAKTKSAHGKPAKDDDAPVALAPCKPAATTKGHKARAAAAKEDRRHPVAKGKAGRHGKAAKDSADTDTCKPAARGDRPDAPGDVSRDSDTDDDTRTAKGKTRAKAHDKAADADKVSEKTTTKGGKHARYASRIWVEVLTGGDRDKMPGEWRALVHKAHKLKGRKPYLTPWHSNFRLLTGPFDSDADAQDFIAELRKDGVSGFEWTSPAGQAVDSLALP